MLFSTDITKQIQEVNFSPKAAKADRLIIFLNEAPVANTPSRKHLRTNLGSKLKFNSHIKEKVVKANKGIRIIRKLAHVLPRESLVIIYKSFI